MIKTKTYYGKIYLGLQEGYNGTIFSYEELKKELQKHEKKFGCVNVVKNEYIYVGGSEPGAIIETINYPRFPATNQKIKEKTLELAEVLRVKFRQNRVSVMFPDETIMIGEK